MASIAATARRPSTRAQLQLFWLKIHRWIGLALLAVFVAMAITGSLLVWPEHFDRMVNPDRYPADASVTPAPPSVFVSAAQAVLPEGDYVSAIRYPYGIAGVKVVGQIHGPAPLDVGPPSRITLWLDPATGEVLSRDERTGGFLWSLRAFHGHLLLATGGREAVAIVGLILLASAGTGLWLWWPGLRNLARSLKWRRQVSVSMNLHRHGGAIIVLILIIEAFTGMYVSVPHVFTRLFDNAAGEAGHVEGPPPTRNIAAPQRTIDEVLASAQAQFPGAKTLSIFLPTEGPEQWIVNLASNDGERTVRIADSTGEVQVVPLHEPSAADRVERVMADIHFGALGPVWQMIVFLSGVLMAVLSVTGFLLWLQRRARKPREIQATAAAK